MRSGFHCLLLGWVWLTISGVAGCGPAGPDDETTSGDSAADGSTADTSTADTTTDNGDTAGDGDPFLQLCEDGCDHIQLCAPDPFAQLYPDLGACVDACLGLWGACTTEGSVYVDCTLALDCSEVVTLLTEGPPQTDCGASYDAAQLACTNP